MCANYKWMLISIAILAASLFNIAAAARLVSVSTCGKISEPGTIPVNVSDRFNSDSPEIHAVAVLDDVSPGTRLKGTWVAIDAIATPNYEIDSTIIVIKESGEVRAHFSISKPNSGWPVGNYRLDFYIDGKLVTATPFAITSVSGGKSTGTATQPIQNDRRNISEQSELSDEGNMLSAEGISGTYVMAAQGNTITLIFRQDSQGKITGSLSSTTGMQYQVEGMVQEGVAVGTCYNNEGGVYFEAYPAGGALTMNLIEPGPDNAPDYNKVKELSFSRQGAARVGSTRLSTAENRTSFGQMESTMPAAPTLSGNEVGDPNWGFKFRTPAGWKSQQNAQGVVLGHDVIAGMIIVFPHMAQSLQEVQSQMQSGLAEGSTQLSPISGVEQIGDNAIGGEYAGTHNGQQVKARGIGTFSPYGGGAYIIALTTPDKYGRELAGAADAIARGMQYARVQASDRMQNFAGTWVTMTKNTQTRVTLFPDGGYSEKYEASYSGGSSDQYGNQDMAWGAARNDNTQGRWAARGTREQGVITISYSNGNTTTVEYRVHVENGETYWNEYWFNGELYGRER
jgi:hypothetical protein